MFKFGVCDIETLIRSGTRSALGRRKRASVLLLNEIPETENAQELYEQIMYGLVDDRGAFKRTSARRFEEFDRRCIEALRTEFSGRSDNIYVHDTGVSNAQTAVDFFGKLSNEIPNVDYLATDYDHELTVLRDGRLAVSLSSDGAPVEIQFRPFVFSAGRSENPVVYPGNFCIRRFLLASRIRRLVERYKQGEFAASEIERIDLFCPAARSLAASEAAFSLGRHDLLAPAGAEHRFDCVRAMNVLNRNYFTDKQMQQVLTNIHDSMAEDGILIAGSNQDPDSPVEGGVYKRGADGFTSVFIEAENDFLADSIEKFARQ